MFANISMLNLLAQLRCLLCRLPATRSSISDRNVSHPICEPSREHNSYDTMHMPIQRDAIQVLNKIDLFAMLHTFLNMKDGDKAPNVLNDQLSALSDIHLLRRAIFFLG